MKQDAEIFNVIVTEEGLTDVAIEVIKLVLLKNKEYRDAWQRYGIFTPLIRLNDKLLRLKSLRGGQKVLVVGESIVDTLRDIVGYGLLALLRLKWEVLRNPNLEEVLAAISDAEDDE